LLSVDNASPIDKRGKRRHDRAQTGHFAMHATSPGTLVSFSKVAAGSLFLIYDGDESQLGLKAVAPAGPALVAIAPGKVTVRSAADVDGKSVLVLDGTAIHPLPRLDRTEIIERAPADAGPLVSIGGRLGLSCMNDDGDAVLVDVANGEVFTGEGVAVVYHAWVVTRPSLTSPTDRDVIFSFDARKPLKLGF
jgi:hypothetical protein